MGTPVVSTNCPSGPSEILQGGKYGTLTPVGDVKALVQAINFLLTTSIDSKRLQKSVERYDISQIAPLYQKLIESLLP